MLAKMGKTWGKKVHEFDYDATRSLQVCLLTEAAMLGYEGGPVLLRVCPPPPPQTHV